MSNLKPRGIPIVLEGEERHFLFTLNTIDEIQDKYDKSMGEIFEELQEEETAMDTLKEIVTVLLNKEAEREKRLKGRDIPEITEEEVGELIGMDNVGEVVMAVFRAYGYSMPEADENDPNQESGQQNK